MKKLILSLTLIMSLLIPSTIYACDDVPVVSYIYTITKVAGNEFYATAQDGSGLYFTADYIRQFEDESHIKTGAKIEAVFDAANTIDGLFYVDLIEKNIKIH